MEQQNLMEQNNTLPGEREENRLATVATEIRMLKTQAANMALGYAVEIGRRLMEAKAIVPHGEWGEWLKREVDYSQSTAQNLMRVYQECGDEQASLFGPSKAQALGNLSFTKVLRIITIPEGPERDEFLETHDVESMSTRELETALKERDEARKAAEEAKASQAAADAAREKMSADMELANERIAGLNAEVEEQSARAKEAQDTAEQLKLERDQLEWDLAELRTRPVEVVVETDTAAIEAARKEAEAAMQDKLDRAELAQAKAEERWKAAEDAKVQAQRELEQARAEAQAALEQAQAEGEAIRARAEKAEKRVAMAENKDLAVVMAMLDQFKDMANKMAEVRMKFKAKNPPVAENISRAMLALCDQIREVAQS